MAHTSKLSALKRMAAAAVFVVGLTPAATAQTLACAARGEVVEWLEDRYQEQPIGVGLIGNRTVIELHVSETGTWTILATDRSGRTCMVSAGHSWTPLETPPADATAIRQ